MCRQLNRLLIVDRAEAATRQFSRLGRRMGYVTEMAASFNDFHEALARFSPTVVLIDLSSVGNDGLGHLKALRDGNSDALALLIGERDSSSLETARQIAEIIGVPVVASPRSPMIVNVVRNELRKARQSVSGATLDELKAAVKSGAVRTCYQPKANCGSNRDGSVTDVEAMLRWHVRDGEILLPEELYLLAEQGGLLPDLTKRLLEQAIAQMQAWSKRRVPLNVAANLPSPVVADPALPVFLGRKMREAGLDPSNLTLEISEALAMSHSAGAMENLRRLEAMGFRLAIDEVGTCPSSLEQLYDLKFNELKVDPSLVLETRISAAARAILEATVAAAKKLGLSVCADGVDSLGTLNYLGRIGCDKAQGDYISRPLSPQSLEMRLIEWNVTAIAS